MRKLLAAFAVLALAACGGTMQDTSSSQDALQNGDIRPTGKGVVHQFAHTGGGGGGRKTTSNGITNHGGPIMPGTVNVYYIWYGNWSGNSATTLLPTFIKDLSGSGYEHINTTYYSSNGTVSGLLNLAGQTTDNYSQGTSFGDSGVQAIVQSAISSGKLPYDTTGLYFVLTSADVKETSGFCSQYCGWHTHGTINGGDIKYSFVGNADQCPSACADQTTSPNNNAGADAMASIIAHESEEAISDPDLNAWYDSRGQENGDKCAWTFGSTSTASNGSKYNFVGSSKTEYLIQQNWVNASGGYCAMSY